MSEPPPTYNAGETVLCYHGPLVYVAKVLKTQAAVGDEKNTITGKDGQHYFVHYKGWKTTCVLLRLDGLSPQLCGRWDEWVPTERLLKDNEVNRALQKSLQKNAPATAAAARAHPKASTSSTAKDSGVGTSASATTRSGTRKETGTRGTKRGQDDVRLRPPPSFSRATFHAHGNPQLDGNRRPEMKLNIPEQIKTKLVDDWEIVTKENKVILILVMNMHVCPERLFSSW